MRFSKVYIERGEAVIDLIDCFVGSTIENRDQLIVFKSLAEVKIY